MQFSTEVLPAPFGPISASSSFGRACSDTCWSTLSPPKASESSSTRSSAIPASAAAVLLYVAVAAPLAAAQIELLDVGMCAQALGRAVENDATVLHHIAVVRDFQRHLRVLLDE